MKVAQVVLSLDHGGLEHLVIQLSEQLQKRGIESEIFSLTAGALLPESRRRGIHTVAFYKRPGFDLRMLSRLYSAVRARGIQVVHTHNMAPLFYGTVSAKIARIPTVNTRHGRAALRARPFVWYLTDHVVAVSEDARSELLRHNDVDPSKVSVVLNGIDVTRYAGGPSSVLRDELGLRSGVPIVGIVARLAVEKDHPTLLRAFEILRRGGGEPHLVIIGGGPLDGELKALAGSLGLSRVTHFLGARNDVTDLMRGLDVFVLSSTTEGVSLTLLEAMAAGCPVVATDVGGNSQVIVHEQTGLLVPPGDPSALARAIRRLLLDPATASRFASLALQRVQNRFGIDRLVDAYVDIYGRVLKTRGHANTIRKGTPDLRCPD